MNREEEWLAPMQTRPDISDGEIVDRLDDSWRLRVARVDFLPVGADVNSFAFRVAAADGATCFLKLRSERGFDEVAALVPAFLRARGVRRVMAPLATVAGRPWAGARGFNWMLFPFFEGRDGFETALSAAQWVALGETLRAVHATTLPAELRARLRREDYSPRYREAVTEFLRAAASADQPDPTAARFAALLNSRRDEIGRLVERAGRLALAPRSRESELVVTHGDLHAGNVLVGAGDEIAIVDWDEVALAPKERDLMFVGGGVGGVWNQPREAAWFHEGYGGAAVDHVALAYYRCERIVADVAAYAEQILGARGDVADREEGLRQLAGQFLPGGVVEIANRSYEALPRP